MKKEGFDIDEKFASLTVRAKANGDMLELREMTELAKCKETDEKSVQELLSLLGSEDIVFYADVRPLDQKRIKEIDETVKNSCEEERTAAAVGENSVRLYLSEIAQLPVLTSSQERELLYELKDGNEDALNELIEGSMYLPVMTAEKYIGRGILFLDLVQEGNLVLMTAAQNFSDPKSSFAAFAAWKLERTMQELTAGHEDILKIPVEMAEDMANVVKEYKRLSAENGKIPSAETIAAGLDMSVDRVSELLTYENKLTKDNSKNTEEISAFSPADEADRRLSDKVKEMLSALPEKEAQLIAMKYGIAGKKEMSIAEIADKLGMIAEDAEKLEQQAMRHLGC